MDALVAPAQRCRQSPVSSCGSRRGAGEVNPPLMLRFEATAALPAAPEGRHSPSPLELNLEAGLGSPRRKGALEARCWHSAGEAPPTVLCLVRVTWGCS